MKRILSICTMLVFAAGSARGATRFEVLRVNGSFSAWSDGQADWLPITRGTTLAEGALVQSQSGGSLRLLQKGGRGMSRTFSVFAETAIICRLTPEILRTVDVESMYMRELAPDIIKKPTPGLNIASAWKKNNMLYNSLSRPAAGDAKGQSTSSSGRGKGQESRPVLDLLHPRSGTIVVTDRFPVAIPIVWASLGHKGAVKVYLGGDGGGSLPLVGVSEKPYMVVPIYDEGSYDIAFGYDGLITPQKMGSFYVVHAARRPR